MSDFIQHIGKQDALTKLSSTLDKTKYQPLPAQGWYAYGINSPKHATHVTAITQGGATEWDRCWRSWNLFQREMKTGIGGQLLKIHVLLREPEVAVLVEKLVGTLNEANLDTLPFATFKYVAGMQGSRVEKLPQVLESEGSDGVVAAAFNAVGVANAVSTIEYLQRIVPQGKNLDNNVPDMLARTLLHPRLVIGQFDRTIKTAIRWRYPQKFYEMFPISLGAGVTSDLAKLLETQGVPLIKGEDKYLACVKLFRQKYQVSSSGK